MTEAASVSETSVDFYDAIWRRIKEDCHFKQEMIVRLLAVKSEIVNVLSLYGIMDSAGSMN
jgi:hypothetical protein